MRVNRIVNNLPNATCCKGSYVHCMPGSPSIVSVTGSGIMLVTIFDEHSTLTPEVILAENGRKLKATLYQKRLHKLVSLRSCCE